jgi:hypothetical protein
VAGNAALARVQEGAVIRKAVLKTTER